MLSFEFSNLTHTQIMERLEEEGQNSWAEAQSDEEIERRQWYPGKEFTPKKVLVRAQLAAMSGKEILAALGR